jgi:hypothetical protein
MYNVTLFRHVWQPDKMVPKKYTFEELYNFLTHPRKPVKKKNQAAWCPAVFRAGTSKMNNNCTHVTMMVIDVDGGYYFDDVQLTLEKLRLKFMMHTSFSCGPKYDRFRVVMPLLNPVPADEWRFYHLGMVYWWNSFVHNSWVIPKERQKTDKDGLQFVDAKAHDSSRAYFAGYRTKYWRCALHADDEGIPEWDKYAQWEKAEYYAMLDKKKRDAEERRKKLEAFNKNLEGKRSSYSNTRKYVYEMLKTQRDWRAILASKLGAKIVQSPAGDRAERWDCPQCQRKDATYFFIDGIANISSAKCGHLKSCGWSGSLGYLAEITGNLGGF